MQTPTEHHNTGQSLTSGKAKAQQAKNLRRSAPNREIRRWKTTKKQKTAYADNQDIRAMCKLRHSNTTDKYPLVSLEQIEACRWKEHVRLLYTACDTASTKITATLSSKGQDTRSALMFETGARVWAINKRKMTRHNDIHPQQADNKQVPMSFFWRATRLTD
mmetsp:Transcript_46309/g.75599  ORF Transcript_46309/g.75599 Transcript_46309/m.75599 type:complete len:162 (+) Transcript_46309:270-755(+)